MKFDNFSLEIFLSVQFIAENICWSKHRDIIFIFFNILCQRFYIEKWIIFKFDSLNECTFYGLVIYLFTFILKVEIQWELFAGFLHCHGLVHSSMLLLLAEQGAGDSATVCLVAGTQILESIIFTFPRVCISRKLELKWSQVLTKYFDKTQRNPNVVINIVPDACSRNANVLNF